MPSDPLKPWGPDNPYPLSRMKTELVWEGKYDEYGNRRPAKLPSFPLVLQPIEHVDVPWDAKKAEQPGLPFEEYQQQAHPDDFRNMLIWGDNKIALAALLDQVKGKVDLIYIDPPFDVGADFTMQIALGDQGDAVAKEQSVLEAVAYRDTWGKGTDSYLHMMAERLGLLGQLLRADGLIVVHCDARVNFAIRSLLDEAIGSEGFRNEIVWKRQSAHSDSGRCGNVHDTLFLYAKGAGHTWNEVLADPSPDYIDAFFDQVEAETGRRYARGDLSAGGLSGGGYDYEYKGIRRVWRCPVETMERLDAEGRLHWPKSGVPRLKRYLDEFRGVPLQDVWADVRVIHNQSSERLGYDTQKPEALLERIIRASSNEGDLVLDCFCGSGTTMAVAEKLGRRWIGVDLGRYAIHVTRKRLMGVQRDLHSEGKPYRPFDVYNLCRYERQWWQTERLKGADHEHRTAVLRLFRAAPLAESPSPLLHGTKGGAMVHVAPIDTIVKLAEAEKVARAAASAGAKRAVILAWEFEMDLRKRIEAVEAETGVRLTMKYIPREIMEPNRDEVQFFDAGALEAEAFVVDLKKRSVDVRLRSFIPSLAEVPEKELEALRERAITSPFDFIDFWAVDFEHDAGKTYFDHHWHAYRTRRDRKLPTESSCKFAYQSPGPKRICVKVIDVFGVDTSVVVEVTV